MEIWDLYGDDRAALGKTARRGDALPPGASRLIVERYHRLKCSFSRTLTGIWRMGGCGFAG